MLRFPESRNNSSDFVAHPCSLFVLLWLLSFIRGYIHFRVSSTEKYSSEINIDKLLWVKDERSHMVSTGALSDDIIPWIAE
eukprot:3630269-Amphidinium_carterae.1